MANHKSAIKRHKQSLNRAARNRAARTRVKSAIKDAILDGIIPNEYEAARAFMLQRAEKMGLK